MADKSVLRKAVTDTPDPTPGYLYIDIVKMTMVDQNAQRKVMDFLIDKLNPKNTAHVLAKTLKVIKHLCLEGHTDFQKEMQRQSEILKPFASYRGTPDQKAGDAYNERVRTNAKEAIDATFSVRKETKIQIQSGTGSDSTYAETDKGFKTGEKVSGAPLVPGGNAHMAPMPQENLWAKKQAEKQRGAEVPGWQKNINQAVATGFGLWKDDAPKTNQQRIMEGGFQGDSYQALDVAAVKGGGGFGFDDAKAHDGGNDGGGWKFTQDGQGGAGGASKDAPPTKEIKMLTPIQKEVERLALFKNTPQRVDLSSFLSKITEIVDAGGPASTWEDCAQAMDERLSQKHPWQQRLNLLTAAEHVLRNVKDEGGDEFKQYFLENPEDIQRNLHVVQSSLKDKASKVLKLLGVPERSAGNSAEATKANEPALLLPSHGGVEKTWGSGNAATAGPATTTSAPSEASSAGDLDFGGMTVGGATGRRRGADQGDKTKLKGRRQMAAQAMEAEEEAEREAERMRERQAQEAAAEQARKAAASTSASRTAAKPASNNDDNGWGGGGGGGWGTSDNAGGFDSGFGGGWGSEPAASSEPPATEQAVSSEPPVPKTVAPQQRPPQHRDAFDSLFGDSPPTAALSAAPVQQQQSAAQQQRSAPKPSSTDDMFDFGSNDSKMPKKAVTPPPQEAPATSTGPNPAMQAMIQQQMQQMNQMMETMKHTQDPALLQQMQAMMQQSQQMINMMMSQMNSAPAAQPPAANNALNGSFGSSGHAGAMPTLPPPIGQSSSRGPSQQMPPVRNAQQVYAQQHQQQEQRKVNDQFAGLNNEAKQTWGLGN